MAQELLPDWKRAWRAFAKQLPTDGLLALKRAISEDDPRLVQKTTSFPSAAWGYGLPVCAACGVGYPLAHALGGLALDEDEYLKVSKGRGPWGVEWGKLPYPESGAATVGELDEAFAVACHQADLELGEVAGCRHFLNWFDEQPRLVVLISLLPEVELALAGREAVPS